MQIESLKKKVDFDKVFEDGTRIYGKLVSIVYKNCSTHTHLGIVVNKKFGGAVQRNKIKRQIREAVSSLAKKINVNFDMVVIPRSQAISAKKADIENEILGLVKRQQ